MFVLALSNKSGEYLASLNIEQSSIVPETSVFTKENAMKFNEITEATLIMILLNYTSHTTFVVETFDDSNQQEDECYQSVFGLSLALAITIKKAVGKECPTNSLTSLANAMLLEENWITIVVETLRDVWKKLE
ncbi:hypothetical protein [Listeria fleischmannii]|uniref:Uncharacterized protein n=1 Tax=Listeria fleischmannii FSL S10-1203 TaxID=1265822 RepID=W7D5A7_9LIST|nr:hypothetical protein [Listeria fleischmannii]EUJ44180.1 hypothetical protein MCOL2_19986 [Listeria fleischmannii FSL S10-1203]